MSRKAAAYYLTWPKLVQRPHGWLPLWAAAVPPQAVSAAARDRPPARLPVRPQSQKNQLRGQLDMASKARESARVSMKELRSSMKFTKGAPASWVLALGARPGCWSEVLGAGGKRGAPSGWPFYDMLACMPRHMFTGTAGVVLLLPHVRPPATLPACVLADRNRSGGD